MDSNEEKRLMQLLEEIDSDECDHYNNMSSDSEADNSYRPQEDEIDSSDSNIEPEVSFRKFFF